VTALQHARTAYAPAAAPIRTPRSTEYELFARITHRLRKTEGGTFAALAAALHENRRLWTILAADVASDGNRLPGALRAQIFYLAEFTRQHSDKVLAGEAGTDPLIEINTAIMKGLRGRGEEA
jgi:flagellar protein FlaF